MVHFLKGYEIKMWILKRCLLLISKNKKERGKLIMENPKHYTLAGTVKCNDLVPDAKDIIAFQLQIETEGAFSLSSVEAKNILGNLFITILKTANWKA